MLVAAVGVAAGALLGGLAGVAVHVLKSRNWWLALGIALVVGSLWLLEDLAGVQGDLGELLAWAARGMLLAFAVVPLVVMVRTEREQVSRSR